MLFRVQPLPSSPPPDELLCFGTNLKSASQGPVGRPVEVSATNVLSLSFSRQQKIAQRTKEHLGDFDPVRGVPAREERFERVTALEGLRPIIDLGRDVLEDAERCVTAAVGRVE